MRGQMNHYDSLGRIGEGTYGVVIKCRHKFSGELVAIKKFKECDDDEQVRKTALREVKVLQGLRHDNVVRLLDVFRVHKKLFLVFEYMEGTVLQALERLPKGLGDLPTRRIMWQLVRATEYLHSIKIVHRDIKPENMLLSSEGMLKLCDFGFARYLSGPANAGDMSDYVATRWYRAPELLVGDRSYGQAVDLWAIGCMVVEMQTGQPLYPGTSDIDQLWLILKSLTDEQLAQLCENPLFQHMRMPERHERQTLDCRLAFLKPDVLDFLKACLHPIPAKRKSCWELLQMPYFFGAKGWFERGFFPSEAKKTHRQAMSVEPERAKARRQKRKSDARHTAIAQALNISPFRERQTQDILASNLMCQTSLESMETAAMQTDSCAESAPADCECHASMKPGGVPDIPQANCSISLQQSTKEKGSAFSMDVRAGPVNAAALLEDECMADAPSVNCNSRQPQPGAASIQLGPRRSQRLQHGGQPEWAGPKWQGAEQRSGAQFVSPDPRMRPRERRQPVISSMQGSSPARQHRQSSHSMSQQSPLKGAWFQRDDGGRQAGNSRGRGQGPQHSQGSPSIPIEHSQPSCDDHNQQGIPAYYGSQHRKAGNENGTDAAHQWVRKGWVSQPSSWHAPRLLQQHDPSRQSPQRWASPSWMSGVAHAESSPGHYRSPLRAHAPVFVPSGLQTLQGTKAEIHHQQLPHPDAL